MQALAIGYLAGNTDTKCVGITEKPNVAYPSGYAVKWPPGIEARTDPVRLLDQDGKVIARQGDLLHLGGGSAHSDPQPPCTERPTFIANEIVKVVPSAGR